MKQNIIPFERRVDEIAAKNKPCSIMSFSINFSPYIELNGSSFDFSIINKIITTKRKMMA